MMNTRIKLIIAVGLFLMASLGFAGRRYVPTGAVLHRNIAQMGMGGLTTTISTNAHTFFYNPALLTKQKFALEITPLVIGLDNDFADVADFVDKHADDFSDLDSMAINDPTAMNNFLADSRSFDNEYLGVKVAPYFGLAFRNFGLGAYGQMNADVKLDQGVIVPALGMRGFFDTVIGLGFAKTKTIAGHDYGIGIAGRVISRRQISSTRISASDATSGSDVFTTAQDELEDAKNGFGIDLGMIRTFKENLDVAFVVRDLVGSMDGWVKPNLNIGVMYHIPFADNILLKRWDVGMEVIDLMNRQGVSYFQKMNFGSELNMLAGLVKLRGGFHQGYPTYGAGIALLFLRVDYAFFTRELGTAPGMLPEESHYIQLSLGW